MNKAKLRFASETAVGRILPRPPAMPIKTPVTAGGDVVYARGSKGYEAMPRTGTVTIEQKTPAGVAKWTGITPVFDDEAGTVTLHLPRVLVKSIDEIVSESRK